MDEFSCDIKVKEALLLLLKNTDYLEDSDFDENIPEDSESASHQQKTVFDVKEEKAHLSNSGSLSQNLFSETSQAAACGELLTSSETANLGICADVRESRVLDKQANIVVEEEPVDTDEIPIKQIIKEEPGSVLSNIILYEESPKDETPRVNSKRKEKLKEVRVEIQRLEETTDPEVQAYFTHLKIRDKFSATLSDDETPCEEEEDCAATTCLHPTGSQVLWVQCDGRCNKWFHFLCEGLEESDVNDEEEYICNTCRAQSISRDALQSSSSNLTPIRNVHSMVSENHTDIVVKEEGIDAEETWLERIKAEPAPLLSRKLANEDVAEMESQTVDVKNIGYYVARTTPMGTDAVSITSTELSKQSAQIQRGSRAKNKIFCCLVCQKLYKYRFRLKIHLRSHTGERPFKCTECSRGFAAKSDLTRHMRTHSGYSSRHICYQCGRSFLRKRRLKDHLLSHSNPMGFECKLCKKRFKSPENLHRHNSNCGVNNESMCCKSFTCDICKKGFNLRSTLITHMRTHTGEKPFKCQTCGRGFAHRNHLKVHLRRHTGEKPYGCAACGKHFISKDLLKYHLAKKHD